jgi:hypothetical protein
VVQAYGLLAVARRVVGPRVLCFFGAQVQEELVV